MTIRLCPSCKVEVSLDAKFCRECGTPLETNLDINKASKAQVEFFSLPSEQQQKIREYANGLEISTDQGQKFFFSCAANNALGSGAIELAVSAALIGLKAPGSTGDQHFIYNALIQAYQRAGDKESAKRYCLAELDEIPNLSSVLKTEVFCLPPSIPCRDELLDIVLTQNDYDEATRLMSLFVKMELLTKDDADKEVRNIEILRLKHKAQTLLKSGDLENAKRVFDEVIKNNKTDAAEIYKTLGNYYFTNNQSEEALHYFQMALDEDPLIKGVKIKVKRLSKELNVETKERDEEVVNVQHEREKQATDWSEKRDIADEYAKIKRFDDAWRNYNQALLERGRSGQPCDTIYTHMARMLEKEGRNEWALFHYVLAYRESFQFSKRHGFKEPDMPEYIPLGIDRCLTKLKTRNVNSTTFLNLVKEGEDLERLRTSVYEIIDQNKS